MRIKTQSLAICLCLAIASMQFFSCKKDNTKIASANNDESIDNAVADTEADSSSLNNGLVAWYTFNGDILDHSGHNNNIIFNSATPAKGKSGLPRTAYRFDGISSYMQAKNKKSLNPLKISLYALVKPMGFYQGSCHGNHIISKQYSGNDNGRYYLGFDDQAYHNYAGCYDTVAYQYENFYGGYGAPAAGVSGANDLTQYIKLNKWYSLVYTFDGVYSKLYVNGVLVNKVTQSTTFTPNTNPLNIGRNTDPGYPYFFNGIIDEVRIYKRALPAAQVLELYNDNNN